MNLSPEILLTTGESPRDTGLYHLRDWPDGVGEAQPRFKRDYFSDYQVPPSPDGVPD